MSKLATFLEEEILWRVQRRWNSFDMKRRGIRWFIQRGRRGYSDADLWSFDWYLRGILAKGLKQFAKNPLGWPAQGEAKEYKDWKKVLNKMADGFQAVIDFEEEGWKKDKYFKKRKAAYKKQNESLKLLTKWFNDLWD